LVVILGRPPPRAEFWTLSFPMNSRRNPLRRAQGAFGFAFGGVLGLDDRRPCLVEPAIPRLDDNAGPRVAMPVRSTAAHFLAAALVTGAAMTGACVPAAAEALLLVELDSGKVLHAENATVPWYPASVTKIMTAYVMLRAVKEGRVTLDKTVPVSPAAALQAPTKMGFPVGTLVTLDNALKMLMVKSANDMAVLIAEGVAGSIENFAEQMNQTAKRLGMTQSHYVNPNGLPADEQIVSARDLAILARATLREFPEYDYYWHLPGIRMGKRVYRNYNTLLGRYPGADGMKTGFICASGFNLVATATRDGKRLIAVVLGAPSGAVRAVKAAQLLERGFTARPLAWLTPSLGMVDALTPVSVDPPNLRDDMCGPHRKRPAAEEDDPGVDTASGSPYAVFLSALRPPATKGAALLQDVKLGEPVPVFTGPARKPGPLVASVDIKPDPKAKRGAATAVQPASAAVPWTSFSSGGLANNPPPELAAAPPGGAGAIPIPRARPRPVVQRTSQVPPVPPAPKSIIAVPPKPATAAKPAPKPNAVQPNNPQPK
jgi:D-alanyl-D-alanine carboxypeptidase